MLAACPVFKLDGSNQYWNLYFGPPQLLLPISCSKLQLRHSMTFPQGSCKYNAFSPYIKHVSPICFPPKSVAFATVASTNSLSALYFRHKPLHIPGSGTVTAIWKKPPCWKPVLKSRDFSYFGSWNSNISKPTPFPQLINTMFTLFSIWGYILKIAPSGVSARSVSLSLRILRKPKTSEYLNQVSRCKNQLQRKKYQVAAACASGTEIATWLKTLFWFLWGCFLLELCSVAMGITDCFCRWHVGLQNILFLAILRRLVLLSTSSYYIRSVPCFKPFKSRVGNGFPTDFRAVSWFPPSPDNIQVL